jgi:hypothetical protein
MEVEGGARSGAGRVKTSGRLVGKWLGFLG